MDPGAGACRRVLRDGGRCGQRTAPGKVVADLAAAVALAGDQPRALQAIRVAWTAARERGRALAGDAAPGGAGLVTVDLDATIVIAHSEKEQASPTWKKTETFFSAVLEFITAGYKGIAMGRA